MSHISLSKPLLAGLGAALMLAAGLVDAAQAIVIRDDRLTGSFFDTIESAMARTQYVNLGRSTKYSGVGMINANSATEEWLGSGTLVGRDWVLTAAHVVDGASNLTFNINGQTYRGAAWTWYPSWNWDPYAGYDIALVKLDRAVTDKSIAISQLYRARSEYNLQGTGVGYGSTGLGSYGEFMLDGLRRAGTNIIESGATLLGDGSLDARLLFTDFDVPISIGANRRMVYATSLEYSAGSGDSGGGLFIDQRGSTLLTGITSFVLGINDGIADGTYGDITGYTRVSSFTGWIDSIMKSKTPLKTPAATTGNPLFARYASAFVTDRTPIAVPEPATLTLLGVALAGAACWARRRRAAAGGR